MIIGLSGKKQHGKDTVCKIIQWLILSKWNSLAEPFEKFLGWHYDTASHHSGWERKQFATKLKKIVCLMIGCTLEDLEDNTFKEAPLSKEWDTFYVRAFNFENQLEDYLYATAEEAIKSHPYKDTASFYKKAMTPRKLLQIVGTECGRRIIHPNIWVNALLADYKGTQDKPKEGIIRYASGYVKYPENKEMNNNPEILRPNTHPEFFDVRYPDWIITDLRFPNEVEAIKKTVGGLTVRVQRPGMPDTDTHESETALDHYNEFDYIILNNSDITDLINQTKVMLQHFKII